MFVRFCLYEDKMLSSKFTKNSIVILNNLTTGASTLGVACFAQTLNDAPDIRPFEKEVMWRQLNRGTWISISN